jgi:capsular exopolysaccharide synthesis family protein
MSRFLDRTRAAQNTMVREAVASHVEPGQSVEALLKPQVVGADVSEAWLAKCRKTQLTLPPDSPLRATTLGTCTAAIEAYRLLRTRLMRAQAAQAMRTVIFTSAGSNEGKTLTALSLAQAYIVLKEQRVLLVDGDLRTRALSQLFAPSSGPGLSDALMGEASLGKVILGTEQPNLFFVSAGKSSTPPPELYASQRWKEFLSWWRAYFTCILIDAPPMFPLSDFDLMSAGCDGVLLIVRAQHTNRDLLRKVAAQIDSRKLLGIVYNATENEQQTSWLGV